MPYTSSDELFSSYQSALEVASRSVRIARALAEGYRAGLRPPDDVLDAYFARLERDEDELRPLRQRLSALTR